MGRKRRFEDSDVKERSKEKSVDAISSTNAEMLFGKSILHLLLRRILQH